MLFNYVSKTLQKLDKAALSPLKPHEGKRLLLEMLDPPFDITLEVKEGMLIISQTKGHDTKLQGKARDLFSLLFVKTPGPHAFYGKNVQILGDTSFLQAINTTFKAFRPDWEDLLSQHLGDVGSVTLTRLFKEAKERFQER